MQCQVASSRQHFEGSRSQAVSLNCLTLKMKVVVHFEMSLTVYHSLQFNLRKPSDYFMRHKFWYSKILRCTHIALMCYVRTLEQTATFTSFNVNRLVLYNQGGRCLLHSTCWVLIYTQTLFIFERLTFPNTAARISNLALLSNLHSGNQEYGWKITSVLS